MLVFISWMHRFEDFFREGGCAMRVAMAQTAIKFEDKEYNRAKALEMFEKAQGNADFIIFPEMCLTGFSMHTERIGERPDNYETLEFFRQCAVKYKIAVCFGMVRLVDGKAYNSAVIIDKDGNASDFYDKIHPFSGGREGQFYTGGDHVIAVKIGKLNVSPFICYDLRFPEPFQAASEKCEFLVVIGNWPYIRQDFIAPLLRARAIENQSYTCFVNTTGFDGKILYGGGSVAFTPLGEKVIEAGEEEGLYIFQLDENKPRVFRGDFNMKADRRNDVYVRLLSEIKPVEKVPWQADVFEFNE